MKTSSAVRTTPVRSEMPKRRFKPIAVPSTSARSQAAIAISHNSHNEIDTGRE